MSNTIALQEIVRRLLVKKTIWSSAVFLLFAVVTYKFLLKKIGASPDTVVAAMTALTVIFGYFITHYLETERKMQNKKMMRYLNLAKGLRLFLNEDVLRNTPQQATLRDYFQDEYFASALFISKDAHEKLTSLIHLYEKHQQSKASVDLENFKQAQVEFINELRKEFYSGPGLVTFSTYNFK